MNYYEMLGVFVTATLAEIKHAYRMKCMEFHPDIHGNNPEYHNAMCILNEIYATLSKPEAREAYDRTLFQQSQSRSEGHAEAVDERPVYPSYTDFSYYYEDFDDDEQQIFVDWLEEYIKSYKIYYDTGSLTDVCTVGMFEEMLEYEKNKIKKHYLTN